MDVAVKTNRNGARHAFLLTALAPVIPQLVSSIFNIWYNAVVIDPLLGAGPLRPRFFQTIIVYNALVYPAGIGLWLWNVFSLRSVYQRLDAGLPVEERTLARTRRV